MKATERSTKKRKSSNYCNVPHCHADFEDEISLYRFPKNDKLQKEWATKLKLDRPVTPNTVVCSNHFQKSDYYFADYPELANIKGLLKPTAIPSRNLPTYSPDSSHLPETLNDMIERGISWFAEQEEGAVASTSTACIKDTTEGNDIDLEATMALIELNESIPPKTIQENKAVQVNFHEKPAMHSKADKGVQVNIGERCSGEEDINHMQYQINWPS